MSDRSEAPSAAAFDELVRRGIDRYSDFERIGSGGMGVVYGAVQRDTGQRVAIKTIHDPSALLHLKNEFRRVADVAHRNLVGLYELVSVSGQWFMVMEFLTGETLKDLIAKNSPQPEHADPTSRTESTSPVIARTMGAPRPTGAVLETVVPNATREPEEILRIFGQVAAGICELHLRGLLHCDIKPSNVMITETGRAVLLDFGLVSPRRRADAGAGLLVSTGGTVAFLAPEQVLGDAASEASDWYAFGLMLFEVLTGRRPFTGSNAEILEAKRQRDVPHLLHGPGVPSALVNLTNALLSRDPSTRPKGATVLAALGQRVPDSGRRRSGTTLIGRKHELDELAEALKSTRESGPVVLRLRGRSGSGKSALVAHFLADLRAQADVLILEGRCYERESVPFKAFDALIDALAHYLAQLSEREREPLLPKHLSDLARVFPAFHSIGTHADAVGDDVGGDGQEGRRRAFGALKQLLRALAARATLVVYVDDVQWGDVDSARLFNELHAPRAPRMLTILSYRSEEAEASAFIREHSAFAAGATRELDLREVDVAPLTAVQACQLAASLLGIDGDDPVTLRIAEEAQGNPLFIEELARHATVETTSSTIDELVRRRVAELPDEARRLLACIAASGRPLPQLVAARAAGVVPHLAQVMNQLRAQKLVRTAGPRLDDLVECYHDRTRESVYASLTNEQSRTVHRELALAYEAAGVDNPEVLADHFGRAGDAQREGKFALAAGDRAAAALAFDTAAAFYARASEVLPDEPDVRVKRADALVNAGRSAAAAPLYLDASEEFGDVRVATALRRRAAEQYLTSGMIDRGMDVLRPLLADASLTLPRSPFTALLAMIWRMVVLNLMKLDFEPGPRAKLAPAVLDRIDLCWTAGKGLGSIDIMRGGYYLVRAALLAIKAREPQRAALGLAQVALLAAARGPQREEKQGRNYLDASERLARRLGDPRVLGFTLINRGAVEFCVGAFVSASKALDEGLVMLEDQCNGVAWECSFARSIQSHCLLELGELVRFQALTSDWLRKAEESDDRYGALWIRTEVALGAMAADDPERARETLVESLKQGSAKLFTPSQLMCVLYTAGLDLYRGRPKAAVDRIDKIWKAAQRSFSMGWQFMRIMANQRRGSAYVALAAGAAGESERRDCLKSARRAAQALVGERRPYAVANGRFLEGLIAHVDRREQDAVACFEAAEHGFRESNMALYLQYARVCRGQIVGGDEGKRLLAEGHAALAGQNIVNQAKWLAVFAPGFQAST